MPTFSIAALWNASAHPERVQELVAGLGALLPTSKPPGLVVALREEEANLELKLEMPGYPSAAIEKLAGAVVQSGGTLVELWRLAKAERDEFRARSLVGPGSGTVDGWEAAALALRKHLGELAARGPAPAGPPPAPLPPRTHLRSPAPPAPAAPGAPPPPAPATPEPREESVPPPAPQPPTPAPAEEPKRRGRRFAVRLEMEFRSELEFVREHATNISNGGLFIRTAHRPPIDSVVTVSVKLPNGERLMGDALVVHVIDDPYNGGVGLAFLSDDPTFAQTLDNYLASLAGPAA